MGIAKDFIASLGLQTYGGASINGAMNCSSILVGNTTINVAANSTLIFIGNSSVSATINSTSFSGTSENANKLGNVAAANYVSNTGNFNLSGNLTFSGTNTNFTSNIFATGALISLGNNTSGNVGIKNSAPTVALHINGNYQVKSTDLGTINSTSNNTISFASGNYYKGTIGGACTLTFSNIPVGNGAFGFIFNFANVGTNITWPSSVKWASASAPTFSSNTDVIVFITHDSGNTIYGSLAIKDGR